MRKLFIAIALVVVAMGSLKAQDFTQSNYGYGSDYNSMVIRESVIDSMELLARSSVTRLDLANILDVVTIESCIQGVDPAMILSIIAVESSFYKDANSFKGASYGRGLMQVSEVALKDYNLWNGTNISTKDLYDISTNIKVGIWTYLQNSRYGINKADNVKMLSAYNLGNGEVRRGNLATEYCKKVFRIYDIISWR